MADAIVEGVITDRVEWDRSRERFDPLLALIGTGRDIWKDQHADEYVASLREGWTGE